MANKTLPEPWLSFFRRVDAQLTEVIRLELFGGFVVTLVHGASRSTADIDAVRVTPQTASARLLELAGKGSALHKKHKVYLDSKHTTVD